MHPLRRSPTVHRPHPKPQKRTIRYNSTSDQRPATSDQRPATSDQRPATSDRWSTVPTRRTVLFVARTLQATTRLLYDVVPLLWEDQRVQAVFTVDDTSEFSGGVQQFLREQEVAIVDWEDAVNNPQRFDLTISASANNLSPLPTPLLVMSHGAGHHKYRATNSGVEASVSGLSAKQLLTSRGNPIPTCIALGGTEQLRRLETQVPKVAPRAQVTGDVCLERLQLSRSQRFRYRRHLGVSPAQRLIFLSSTWGPDALLAQRGDLVARVLSHLPNDEFRVVAAWHPNCWQRHGHTNIAAWAGPALRAGLMLIPPHEGWRAALVAADCVITDHGSVGFYAAAVGKPVVFATHSDTETPKDTPAAVLAQQAPQLAAPSGMAAQLRALTSRPPPDYSAITGEALARDRSAAEKLRSIMYQMLQLAEPAEPVRVAAVPLPDVNEVAAPAHHVYIDDSAAELVVERFAASDTPHPFRAEYAARVLVVDSTEVTERRRRAASVLVWTESTLDPVTAKAWAWEVFAELPGLELAVARLVNGEALICARNGDCFSAAPTTQQHLATIAAVIHVSRIHGRNTGVMEYRTGHQRHSLRIFRKLH